MPNIVVTALVNFTAEDQGKTVDMDAGKQYSVRMIKAREYRRAGLVIIGEGPQQAKPAELAEPEVDNG